MQDINTPSVFNLDNELKTFALNDYVKKTTQLNYLEKADPNSGDYEFDDLLLTNAVNEDTIGDKIDKSRYGHLRTMYLNVDSRGRNKHNVEINKNESIYSTGDKYLNYYESLHYN